MPVDVFNDSCPEEGKHIVTSKHRGQADIQVKLDFKLIMKDKLECFYTQDGYVAIDCAMLGNMYIEQVLSITSSQHWYLRQFSLADSFWRDTHAAIDKNDTRDSRSV